MIRLKRALDLFVWFVTILLEAIWALWQAIRGREICGMWVDFEKKDWVFRYSFEERDELRQSHSK